MTRQCYLGSDDPGTDAGESCGNIFPKLTILPAREPPNIHLRDSFV